MGEYENIITILEKYSSKEDLIPAMQEIQELNGFLSEDTLSIISKKLCIPLAHISGVATFYSQFRLKPIGKYNIKICRGTACHIHNSDNLLTYLEQKLKIKCGEVTKDKKFGLESVNCIGACAKAPAMMINKKVYGNLTKEKINQIINSMT